MEPQQSNLFPRRFAPFKRFPAPRFFRARYQLVIESRVTSDDLQQAVSANTDKIVAVQSSVDSALGDNFRRTQDMVQSQV